VAVFFYFEKMEAVNKIYIKNAKNCKKADYQDIFA